MIEHINPNEAIQALNEKPLPPLPEEAKIEYRKIFFRQVEKAGFTPEPENAYAAASDFLLEWAGFNGHKIFNQQYAPPRRGLLIAGPTGTGKTILSEMIHKAAPKYGIKFTFYQAKELIREVMERGSDFFEWYRAVIKNKPLIIDDIGIEGNPTIFGVPHGIAEILDDRHDEIEAAMRSGYARLKERPAYTIVTTNLGSIELHPPAGRGEQNNFKKIFNAGGDELHRY